MSPPQKVLSRRKVATTAEQNNHEGAGEEEEEEGLVLPHEEEMSSRTLRLSGGAIFHNMYSTDDEALDQTAEEYNKNHLKDDIFLASPQRSQKSFSTTRSSLYSPKICPICLEEYKVGEEIAWSNNHECPHAFHLDCILDWLMENDDCPLCRGKYLYAEEHFADVL